MNCVNLIYIGETEETVSYGGTVQYLYHTGAALTSLPSRRNSLEFMKQNHHDVSVYLLHEEYHAAEMNCELCDNSQDGVHVKDVRQRTLLRQGRQRFRSKHRFNVFNGI